MIEIPTKARSATLAKGLKILNFLGSNVTPQSLRQVMAGLGMTKPTAHRLLATLADHGMVRFDSTTNTYRLGMRLFELSRQVWQDFDLRGSASTEMQKLQIQSGETVSLAILTPDGGVYIDEFQSNHHIREQSRVGQRVSKWSSAIGKAMHKEAAGSKTAAARHPCLSAIGATSIGHTTPAAENAVTSRPIDKPF